jgi:alpha,alpha-trehalase
VTTSESGTRHDASVAFEPDTVRAADDEVRRRWASLTHDGSRLAFPVPHRYVGAGGFFDWLFYWDSYFIVLGLTSHGLAEVAGEVVDSLLLELEAFGFVPNFNSPDAVCLSRSQPPLLTAMIGEVAASRDLEWLAWAAEVAGREYESFWCAPPRVTLLGLSRYADDGSPCPTVPDTPHHRVVAESGWDNTPRFGDDATDVVAVDLNALLHRYELDLASFAALLGRDGAVWRRRATERRSRLDRILWRDGRYVDVAASTAEPVDGAPRCLAAFVPLWAGAASPAQAAATRALLPLFEHDHGLVTCEEGWPDGTEHNYPVGWAYSHWFTVDGLRRYGYADDATRIARKWVQLVADRYRETGEFWERYDVVNSDRDVAGRYTTQSGFGWTNGVHAALVARVPGLV